MVLFALNGFKYACYRYQLQSIMLSALFRALRLEDVEEKATVRVNVSVFCHGSDAGVTPVSRQ